MNRRLFSALFSTTAAVLASWALVSGIALAQTAAPTAPAAATTGEAPDAMIKRLSVDVLETIKSDKSIQGGDISKVIALVDSKIMPNVNFQRMTASAVGRNWRSATPEQQKRLQEEFKTLLVRTYAGALAEVRDQTIAMKPLRAAAGETEVVVRSEIKGNGEPINLDYRLEKTDTGWKIYDLNVASIWLVETYRSQFSQEINASGVDGLIKKLAERNKSKSAKATTS